MATDTESPSTPLLNSPPASSRRKWISVGVGVFLLSQVVIPITYYLRGEPTSERFAWRMFSSIHMSQWDTHVVALVEQNGRMSEREIPLDATLQYTFVKTVEAAQLDIVEPFLKRIADQPGVKEVRFRAQGTFPSGKSMKPILLSLKPGEAVEEFRE